MSEELTPQATETDALAAGGQIEEATSAGLEAQKTYSESEVQDLLMALKSERAANKTIEMSVKEKAS